MKPNKDETYWRKKLDAYMHDSPEKALDIVGHARRAEELKKIDALAAQESYAKEADFNASAADRLPWPDPRKSGLMSPFHGDRNSPFRHPLGKADIAFESPFRTVEEALEGSFRSRPVIEEKDPRLAFLARWRFWKNWASDVNAQFGFLPAESRLPDHTIWNHMQITSALQGCADDNDELAPAFLLVSIGPVQDFIAAARSTRDLWSGSYLLSYLVASALAEVAMNLGPDQVVFPNLQNQPLLDLLMKPVWDKVHTSEGESLWPAFQYYDQENGVPRLLTPTLPNRFLLLVPKAEARAIGRWLEDGMRNKLREIAVAVAEAARPLNRGGERFNEERFHRQITALPEIFWQVFPWPKDYPAAKSLLDQLPRGEGESTSKLASLEKVLQAVPDDQQDDRITEGGVPKTVGAAWPVLYHMVEWLHSGTKKTRVFSAWDGASAWSYGIDNNKDSLNGKEEVVLMVEDEDDAAALRNTLGKGWEKTTFRANERIGGSTLLKRLWHRAYLAREHPFDPEQGVFAMPNTHDISKGHQEESDEPPESREDEEKGGYYAVLALDGDEMGKWIFGQKMPALEGRLSKEAREYFQKKGEKGEKVLTSPRPLNPSFHLQFSEMLANFSLYCVRPIIEAHRGRLIYAGGDDVLAMLPAERAMDCAFALRQAFRGENKWLSENVRGGYRHGGRRNQDYDPDIRVFDPEWEGRGTIKWMAASTDRGDQPLVSDPRHFPVLVPGPGADCSVGIAIGHAKAPLQDMVGAAQAAEKRAKRDPREAGFGRSAVAVSIFKRSGEILEWGAKWPSKEAGESGIPLFQLLLNEMQEERLSARFPYRFLELIAPYSGKSASVTADASFAENLPQILTRDLEEVLQRQGVHARDDTRKRIADSFNGYVRHLLESAPSDAPPSEHVLEKVAGLFQTLAWVAKNNDKEK